jgi:hypothetical protein
MRSKGSLCCAGKRGNCSTDSSSSGNESIPCSFRCSGTNCCGGSVKVSRPSLCLMQISHADTGLRTLRSPGQPGVPGTPPKVAPCRLPSTERCRCRAITSFAALLERGNDVIRKRIEKTRMNLHFAFCKPQWPGFLGGRGQRADLRDGRIALADHQGFACFQACEVARQMGFCLMYIQFNHGQIMN